MTNEPLVAGRWTAPGVRRQTTVIATLVIAATLLLGGAAMVAALAQELTSEAQSDQTERAGEAADLVRLQGPQALADHPVAGHLIAGGLLQVVDSTGQLAWTSNPRRAQPASDLLLAPGQTDSQTIMTLFGGEDDRTIAAQGVSYAGQEYTVLAVGSLRAVEVAVRRDALSILIGAPLLAVLGGFAAWVGVGRTLRPVEEIRTSVEAISGHQLDARVPEPPGDDEIARLARTMNSMLDRLDHAQQSQRRFVADASHELRSPIATLSGGLEILADQPAELPELLPVLSAETRRLAELAEGLLLLAKADAGRARSHQRDVDLDEIVAAEARRLRAEPGLEVLVRTVPARVSGDQAALARLVRNLADNARSACQGRIGLELTVAGATAIIRVDDDGLGIAPEDRQVIFDRFVRLDESRSRRPGGAGLGLAIVQATAQAQGGSVSVGESAWGGARFEVRLPMGATTGELS